MVEIKHLEYAPWLQIKPLIALFDIYRKAGYEIRPVGGCIRDALLNKPINDWDLTTNATPEASLDICKNAGLHTIPTGLKHGTITAIFDDIPFEITTLRIDTQSHGRHTDVIWTNDWAQDAMRRDFTINSLYGDQNGDIYDYTGGIRDLKQHIIRFVGNAHERVAEDYLRILRFFRFMARFGDFTHVNKPSLNACIQLQSGLKQISAERIRDELFKILVAPQRHLSLNLMAQQKIFETINLPVENLNFTRLDENETKLNFMPSALRALAYMLTSHTDWANIANQIRLSNQQKKHLLNIQKYMHISEQPTLKDLRNICYHAGINVCRDIYIIKYFTDSPQVDWHAITPPSFPITGKDLIALGIKADKNMGTILYRLEQTYIATDFTLTKDQLLGMV